MPSEGALIIYHKRGTNEILLGNEGKRLWENENLTGDRSNKQRVTTEIFDPFDLKNFDKRENATKTVVGQIEKIYTSNFLVPPVKISSDQTAAKKGTSQTYSSRPYIQKTIIMGNPIQFGAPKGGKEGTESPLHNMLREIQEEIGNLKDEHLPKLANERVILEPSNYTLFYKSVDAQGAQEIQNEINRRKGHKIGEMYNLEFRNFIGLSLNDKTKKALEYLIDKGYIKTGAAATGVASGAAASGAASGAAPRRGGRRYTKKQRKHKKTKKHTRRR